MAVKGCLACVKYIVVLINFIFWLAGIGLLGISIWMYLDTTAYLAADHNDKFFVSIYILMAAGALMTLVGFLGCCGAMQESSCMLGTFATFVILIFAAEIAGAVYGYSNQEEVKKGFAKRVTNMIKNEYSVQDAITLLVDKMNEKFECCGAVSIKDWSNSSFNNKTPSSTGSYRVPTSCCVAKYKEGCERATEITSSSKISKELHTDGCLLKIEEAIGVHLKTIMIVGISIAVVQIFGFVFSLVLCCAVSSRDY